MSKRPKPLLRFASEAEERAFWKAPCNDSTAYFDASKSVRVVLPNLKATTPSISPRLPDALLTHIKAMANSALPVVDEPKQVPHFL